MIYITGDCHGKYNKFSCKNFPEQREFDGENYIIVCGDFGYWSDDKEQRYWFNWLKDRPFKILFVDGNHENFDALNSLPVHMWNGGKVHKITDNIIHLMRGQIFKIESKEIFTFGGAQSNDIIGGVLNKEDSLFKEKKRRLSKDGIPFRINHESWWEEELPSSEEFLTGIDNLNIYDWKVDYVISHCCSGTTQELMGYGENYRNRLTAYFDLIKLNLNFNKWYFGHYHKDKQVTNKEIAIYNSIMRLS